MKICTILSATVLLAAPIGAQEKSPELKELKDKVSYSIGLNIGFNFKKQGIDLNPDALLAGVKDALAGKPKLDESQVRETMTSFTKEVTEKQKASGEKNKAEADKFLADNKNKPGVKTTASGLQYKVLKEGSGPQPTASDTVTV